MVTGCSNSILESTWNRHQGSSRANYWAIIYSGNSRGALFFFFGIYNPTIPLSLVGCEIHILETICRELSSTLRCDIYCCVWKIHCLPYFQPQLAIGNTSPEPVQHVMLFLQGKALSRLKMCRACLITHHRDWIGWMWIKTLWWCPGLATEQAT